MLTVHGHGLNDPPRFRPVSTKVNASNTSRGMAELFAAVIAAALHRPASPLAYAMGGSSNNRMPTILAGIIRESPKIDST
jgi:hypothetical protein